MLSLEPDMYVEECVRRLDLERAELRIKRGIAAEIDNAGLGIPDWLTALGRGLRSRLRARRLAAPATAIIAEGTAGAGPASSRLCAGERWRRSLICDDCGAVIRTSKPACSTTARRARKPRGAANRQTV